MREARGAHRYLVHQCLSHTHRSHSFGGHTITAPLLGAYTPHLPRPCTRPPDCRTYDAASACAVFLACAYSLGPSGRTLSSCTATRSPTPFISAPARNWLLTLCPPRPSLCTFSFPCLPRTYWRKGAAVPCTRWTGGDGEEMRYVVASAVPGSEWYLPRFSPGLHSQRPTTPQASCSRFSSSVQSTTQERRTWEARPLVRSSL